MGYLTIGVPQGSILGPLLFLLYVNDFHNMLRDVSAIQFADDTSIFSTNSSLSDAISKIQFELSNITEWLNNNELSLNILKTKYMIMSTQKLLKQDYIPIKIDGKDIDCVTEIQFLGVILDSRMTFKSHVYQIASKLSKGVGIMSRVKHSLYSESLKTVYNALIKPYVTYCIIIWGGTDKTYLNKLEILLKRIVRMISNADFNAHTKDLFKLHAIMTVGQLYEYFVAVFVYKCINCNMSNMPSAYSSYFHNNIMPRNSHNLRPGFCKKKVCECSLKTMGPRIWNNIPTNIRNLNSLEYFKYKLRRYFIIVR